MKIEIKNRWTGAVIYTHEADEAMLRDAVLAAVRQGVSLSAANLSAANLRDADLGAANLRDADLGDADLSAANLRDADLSAANLRDADLSAANLRDADLSAANLRDADLSAANLRDADLGGANLGDADLRDADLGGANLGDADLGGADLGGANLTPIRDDIWAVLSSAPREVPAVIEALKAGRVDGTTYGGECSCLVGTIARTRDVGVDCLESLKPNSSRPAERFFMGIRAGDTPETSQFSALALEWTQQWLDAMQAAFGAQAGIDSAALREDLSAARSGWEATTEAVRDADKVRELLVAALTLAERFMAGFEGDDLQKGIDAQLEQIRATLAAAGVQP